MIHDYATKPRLTQRINFRVVAVLVVFAVLVGYPVISFVQAQRNHGIEEIGRNAYHVDLQALGYFPFDDQHGKLTDVPERYRTLDGKQVTVEGYMVSDTAAAGQVHNFQFVYNVAKCCFGGPPRVQERVFGVVPHGKDIPVYSMYEMVRMTGTLHVKIGRDSGGKISEVYTMEVADVQPVS